MICLKTGDFMKWAERKIKNNGKFRQSIDNAFAMHYNEDASQLYYNIKEFFYEHYE